MIARRDRGQSPSEITLVVSVVVLALLAASTVLIPVFSDGAKELDRARRARPAISEKAGVASATPDDASGALREMSGDMSAVDAVTSAIGPPSSIGG